MKRPLSLVALIFALCAFPASAILDTNSNGLSDLWERMYNEGELFLTTDFPYGLQDDLDGDGWTNAKEAAAGTDPFDPNPPDGLIRPESEYIPEFWADVDNDNELEFVSASIRTTWPTIPGKYYTLLYSPDLVDWLPVPNEDFIGNGTVVDYYFTLDEDVKLFWRVAIEDVDSDSDGLTNAEEAALGTNPNNAQTLSGYDDLWLATNFTEMLLNGQFAVIDTDGDGLTNAQEAFLGNNPNVSDNPGIVQESIRNGDFSIPSMDNQDGLNKDANEPGWNYWAGLPELQNAHSWTAVVGTNIEYQIKEPIETANPYCELKAEPEDHFGIKQQVGTRIGITYLLILDCKARQNTAPANNEFSVKIDGNTVQSITPTSTWTPRAVSFKATNVITEISLVPTDAASPSDKMGCLVDNVKLMPIGIKTVSFSGDTCYQLKSDDDATSYAAPHWVDLNSDGKATTTLGGERNYPISYKRSTKPKLGGTFELNSTPVGCPLKIKATSSYGLQIPETSVYAPVDGTVTLPSIESSTPLIDEIKFFNAEDSSAFKIDWFIKVADSEWAAIGSTLHTMSITLATPTTSERQESLFAISCNQGQGAGSEAADAITEKIFAYFKGLDVRQMKPSSGTPRQDSFTQKGMGFYARGGTNTPDGFTKELLANGDGRCTGWAHFLNDCLAVHGIAAEVHQVVPIYNNPSPYVLDSAFMLIKTFNFTAGSLPSSDLPFTHDNGVDPPEVTKGQSIPAQSDNNPPQRFRNHYLVFQNSRVFDPSYGVGPCTLPEWESAAISGYYCMKTLDEDNDGIPDVDSNGNLITKKIAKQKTPNQAEIEIVQP